MNKNKLIKMIAEKEGKKHQASVGDVREIVKILFDLVISNDEVAEFCDLHIEELREKFEAKKAKALAKKKSK